jgi:hypothetical protein
MSAIIRVCGGVEFGRPTAPEAWLISTSIWVRGPIEQHCQTEANVFLDKADFNTWQFITLAQGSPIDYSTYHNMLAYGGLWAFDANLAF